MNPDLMANDPSVENMGVSAVNDVNSVPSMFASHTWAWMYIIGSMAVLVILRMFFKKG